MLSRWGIQKIYPITRSDHPRQEFFKCSWSTSRNFEIRNNFFNSQKYEYQVGLHVIEKHFYFLWTIRIYLFGLRISNFCCFWFHPRLEEVWGGELVKKEYFWNLEILRVKLWLLNFWTRGFQFLGLIWDFWHTLERMKFFERNARTVAIFE